MRRLALSALLLTAPLAAQADPGFLCQARSDLGYGYVETNRFMSAAGVRGFTSTTWAGPLSPGGIEVLALWRFKPPGEDIDSGFVYFDYGRLPPGGRYRFEVRRPAANGTYPSDFTFRSPMKRPESGRTGASMSWSALGALAANVPSLNVVLVDLDGDVVRSETLNYTILGEVMLRSAINEAELDKMAADYATRCRPMPQFLPARP